MVELTLPKNSRMTEGKVWPKPASARKLKEFRIYRYDPDTGENPRVDTYFSGKVDFLPDNFVTSRQKAYHTTNLRLTWNSPNSRYKVDAFVANIEDDDIISNDGLQSISLGQQVLEPDNFVYYPPRTYGLRVGVNF